MPVFVGGSAAAVHIKNGIKAVVNKEEHWTLEFISEQLLCGLLLPAMVCVWRSSEWRCRLAISDIISFECGPRAPSQRSFLLKV